ncbi:pollen-specific leucine-rich repeat extensin-like protein 4 [Punica granatum]|uniref:Pollen-specific leucine-rich repeat extensin-like protein 4 n=2 Tax=Punica granatum TaxID=22663 RepID=A0A6P8DH26_PUNGR|nr:pollen-specific leucine-rich repeat extensin-like protein 4 [Punica granatum]PKI70845.1 hypothetical protein CRG98_008736 [Punica granatum]
MTLLEGNVTTLKGIVDLMVANMGKMMALLSGPNRASLSPTPPLARGSMVDPGSRPPIHQRATAAAPAPIIVPAPAPHLTHVPAIHLVDFFQPQSTILAAVSLPPMTILVPNSVIFAPPPVPMLAPATVYTVPSPMGFPASSAHAPAHATEPSPYEAPQPHIGLFYQAPHPINITFFESGTLTYAALIAPPTNFLPETETERERRMKKMEETSRALQVSDPRHSTSYLDLTLFLGMQLPPKVKVPNF